MRKVFMKSDQFWPDCDRRASRSKDLWTEHVLLHLCVSPHFCTKFMLEKHVLLWLCVATFFILATLGDHWPLAIGLKMANFPQKGCQGSPRFKGDPRIG